MVRAHVDLHGNLLAGNAGAGVEILNIHPGDHSADLDFYDNTFSNNSRTYNPGGASIWEFCQDRALGTPSGLIRDNLYTEPKGSMFFAGCNIASVKNSDNLSISTVSNYAAEGFSSKQTKAIDLVSGKDVTRIWPAKGGKQLIAGKDQAGYSADVNNI